ncbi:sigma-70 family RNA polymerase sigma factor [Maribellus luteus]|uniref:Sigma-70 family RNA polymerase sigma factor n=1 Tax=Maribellus luteus TaxID=2305463 RepID=A0A399SXL7_9BACT|nr:sigma-70 family RNA polymerase sigma factor [Maribellus luteus]
MKCAKSYYFRADRTETNLNKGSQNTEKNLIYGLNRGDHDSFRALFDLYSKPLFQFSLNYLKSKDAAEDVVQEVFSKVWSKKTEIKSDTSFKSYLFTIALNAIRKQFNKLSKLNEARHEILFSLSSNKPVFDDKDDYQALLNKLEELIDLMPEKRKQVFVMKKLQEKSLNEIASELDISSKTVEYHITEAMKFLKSEFEKLKAGGLIFFHLFVKRNKTFK